jgi:DNA-binding HxlR family transcriptional regulator
MKMKKPAAATPIALCPVEQAIHVIGGKWKLLVLRSLLLNGRQRTSRCVDIGRESMPESAYS